MAVPPAASVYPKRAVIQVPHPRHWCVCVCVRACVRACVHVRARACVGKTRPVRASVVAVVARVGNYCAGFVARNRPQSAAALSRVTAHGRRRLRHGDRGRDG